MGAAAAQRCDRSGPPETERASIEAQLYLSWGLRYVSWAPPPSFGAREWAPALSATAQLGLVARACAPLKAQLGSLWGPNVKCEGPFGHELSPKQRKWALSSRQVGVVRAQLGRAGSAMEAMWGLFGSPLRPTGCAAVRGVAVRPYGNGACRVAIEGACTSALMCTSRARLAEYSYRYRIFVPPFSVAYASYVSCARGQMWPRVHLRGRARAHTARALKH